jgi:hypothetical protein
MTDTLRDQIAAALIARIKAAVLIDPAMSPGMIGQPFAATEYDLADAVMVVVSPGLDGRDDEIARLREQLAAAEAVIGRDVTIDSWLYRRMEQAEADALRVREGLEHVRRELSSVEARGIQDNDHHVVLMARHLRATLDPTEQP